jgi:hypothetical protein
VHVYIHETSISMAPLLMTAFLVFKNETEPAKCSNEARFADCRKIQTAACTLTTAKLEGSSTGGFAPSFRIVSKAN